MPALTDTEETPWWKRAADVIGQGAFGSAPQQAPVPQPDRPGPALGQPAPTQAPPPGAAPPPQQGPPQPQASPQQGVEIAQQSAEAVKTASPNDKKEINKALEEQLGGPKGLERAYEEAIERLGGLKTFDPKMKREDWGLFIMDFGLRMMAASSDQNWNQDAVGAMGEAGIGAIGALRERQAGERGFVTDYNEQVRGEAMDFAKLQAPNKDNIIWTEKGAFNLGTGDYQRSPEGGVLQPGQQPGASNKPFAQEWLASRLSSAGWDEASIAGVLAGNPTPMEVRAEAQRQLTRLLAADERLAPPGWAPSATGSKRPPKVSEWSEQDKANWMEEQVRLVQGGALQQPGPAAEGRGRPETFGKY